MSAAAPETIVPDVPAVPSAVEPVTAAPATPAAKPELPDPFQQVLGEDTPAKEPEVKIAPKALTDEQKAAMAQHGVTEDDLAALGAERAEALLTQWAKPLEPPAAADEQPAAPSAETPIFDEALRETYAGDADLLDAVEKGVQSRVSAAIQPIFAELEELQMAQVLRDADDFFSGLPTDQRKQYGNGPTDPESPQEYQKARAAVLDKAEEIAAGRITKGLPVNRRVVLREAWAAINHATQPAKPDASKVTGRARQVMPTPTHRTGSPTADLPDPFEQVLGEKR
jgi:hypothetical protein